MTSTNYRPLDIYRRYPEENPYELQPPVYNLIPFQDEDEVDTPLFKHAALDIARRTGINVLALSYGQYPFLLGRIDETEVAKNPAPITQYQPPPQLPKAELPDNVVFVKQRNKTGNMPIFIVKIGNEERFLKIYPDNGVRRSQSDDSDGDGEERPLEPMELFDREKEAYAHLKHAGICDQGHVPRCYGWVELTAVHVDAIARVAPKLKYGESGGIKHIQKQVSKGRLPKGILLEYFPDATTLSIKNVTYELAEQALRSLWAIHSAYVQHGDIDGRNVLVLPGDRVIWVDFNHSRCASDPSLTRADIFFELHEGWSMFYMQLLPNQRIGWSGYLEAPME